MPPPRVFYRSPVTRVLFVLTGAGITYALSPLGPPAWHDTPSLRWLNALLPLWLLWGLFATYTVLHLIGSIRCSEIGAWIGLFLYGIGLVALVATTRLDRPANPLVVAAVILACALHYLAARLATFQGARK